MRVAAARLVRVRCLGPGKEHEFLSRDKVTERVCSECRGKLDRFPLALRDRPVRCGIRPEG